MGIDVRSSGGAVGAGIYRGVSNGRPIGVELAAMRIQGQEVIRSQRTRWQFNRSMYRGDQYLRPSGTALRTLAPQNRLPSGRRRDVVNRTRRFVDGRASLVTMSKPTYTVPAENNTRQAYQASDLATKVMDYFWDKLDLTAHFRTMVRSGDVDGIAFLAVYYDREKGDELRLPFSLDGQPIADPGMLIAMDAMGTSTWEMEENTGDICVRNVPIGRLSIDPLARDGFHEARWVIESRIQSRADVEREAGKTVDELLKEAGKNAGRIYPQGTSAAPMGNARVSIDEFDEADSTWSARDYLLTHEAFIRPTGKVGDWPKGCHAKWIDAAPGNPVFVEPWKHEIPYICYVPQPDDGHFIKSKAVTDDLAPLNIAINRAVSQYHELLDLYARAPIMAQRGSLVSKFVYNDKRVVEYQPGYQPPSWMTPPPEPTQILANINFLLEQMAEIAVQSDVARGTPPGQGIDAGVSLNFLAQQNEQQLSGLATSVKRAIEDCCTMVLNQVCEFFTVQRTIAIPGVYGVEEVNNFVGSMLKGCTRVRVTGSLLPRNAAAQQATLMSLVSSGAVDMRPYLSQLTEGRVGEIVDDLERHEREQRNENRQMDLLGSIPNIDELWQQFQQMRAEHARALSEYEGFRQAEEQLMAANGEDPTLLDQALPPPPPAPVLANIGITVPMPNEWNDDALHLSEEDRRRTMEGYMELHPLIRQAYHEHAEGHIARMRDRLDAARPQPGMDPASMGAGASQGAPAPTAGNATAGAVASAQPALDGGSPPQAAPVQMSFAEGAFQVDSTSKETLQEFSDRLIQAVEAINVPPPQIQVNPTPVTMKPNITVQSPSPARPNITVEPAAVQVRERPPLHVRLTGVERDKQGRITGADFKASEESNPPAAKE